MKEYVRLADEFIEGHPDDTFGSLEMIEAYQAGFLKARELAAVELDRFPVIGRGFADFVIRKIGEKEV